MNDFFGTARPSLRAGCGGGSGREGRNDDGDNDANHLIASGHLWSQSTLGLLRNQRRVSPLTHADPKIRARFRSERDQSTVPLDSRWEASTLATGVLEDTRLRRARRIFWTHRCRALRRALELDDPRGRRRHVEECGRRDRSCGGVQVRSAGRCDQAIEILADPGLVRLATSGKEVSARLRSQGKTVLSQSLRED